ncbi:MAG: EAL domain-containing protein [Pseudomonadota bacterium]
MLRSLFGKFRDTLLRRPSPEDVQVVLEAGPIAALVTALLAIIFALSYHGEGDGPVVYGWAGATVLLSLFMYLRGRKAARREVAAVSRSGSIRIVVFSLLFASPWSALAFLTLGRTDLAQQMIALMVCAGLCSGAAIVLHRTLLAATAYFGVVLLSVIAAFALRGQTDMWPVTIYVVLYGLSLLALAFLTARMSKAQETSNNELSELADDLHAAHEEISVMAFVDPVTDLPNRSVFGRQVHEQIARAEEGQGFAVFLLDLDGFKNVNDGIGYHAGDQLLQVVATRLREALGPDDEVARLWADEFALVVKGVDEQAALKRAAGIINSVSKPAMIDERAIYPNASIGGALYPRDGETEHELIRKANIALHRAKENGRGRCVLYTGAMSARIAEIDRIEHDLHVALLEGQIEIHYQPKIDLETGAPLGAEALVRWNHPKGGVLTPDQFLGVAAERGMMLDVSSHIFEVIARDIVAWRDAGAAFGKIAINIHPLDLKSPTGLLANLRRLLTAGVRQSDVVIEITEGCFVGRDTDEAAIALDAIHEMGFELALDDFGTGHASLSHLRKLPIHELKIDREFVSGICHNQHDLAIVSATIEIARCLDLRTVAEGVETAEQIAALREVGADIGQGYHWCKPVPAAEYLAFFEGQRTVASAPPPLARLASDHKTP